MVLLSLLSSLVLFVTTNANDDKASQPNIIFVMLDDLGYADISARGGEFTTPNLDQLYQESIVLNYHYSGLSVCSPSRTQFLTGRYAWNLGISDLTNFGTTSLAAMPAGLPTISNLFKDYTNYKTYAMGKWHVGYSTSYHTPLNRGFDEFYGFLTSGISYSEKVIHDPVFGDYMDWWSNDVYDFDTQHIYSTEVTGNYVNQVIRQHSDSGNDANKPFFIYASFQAPHETLEYVDSPNVASCINLIDTNDEDSNAEKDWSQERYLYCVNVLKVDQVIGQITNNLKQLNLYQNTLIVFTSDNGGAYFKGACNYPLLGGKGEFFEGGVRTMAFVSGGAVSKPQRGTERNGLMHGADWTPTLLSIAGVDLSSLASNLHTSVYEPLSKKVSLRMHSTTSKASKYLIDTSFDGLDLSKWLLNGDETQNPRTDVALSIATIDSNNIAATPQITSNTAGSGQDGGDISVVFKSDITGNLYKLMYLTSNSFESEACSFTTDSDDIKQRSMRIKKFETNKLLFDLTLQSTEKTNLYDYITTNEDVDDDDDDNRRRLKNKNKNKNKKTKVNKMGKYSEDNGELVSQIWSEGEDIVMKYTENIMFSDYLKCTETAFDNKADPSKIEPKGYKPFFTWDEYTEQFDRLCKDTVNNVLYDLYTTRYDTLKNEAMLNMLLEQDIAQYSSKKIKVVENIIDENNINNINAQDMELKQENTTQESSNKNKHIFGRNHVFVIVGLISAVMSVIIGYCIFYCTKRRHYNDIKYSQYSEYTEYTEYTQIAP